ncbi:MAG: cupredoxin domain-containing protein [Chitinophagaceae bacterium]|nr:cupredoxin domain-containing protein [Chitinophagaceae bacterium]
MLRKWQVNSIVFILFFISCNTGESRRKEFQKEGSKSEAVTIEIKNMKFVPDSIEVKKGDKIVFVNRDMVNHCVTEKTTKAWTSGSIAQGQSYEMVADKTTEYFCAIHVVMKGKIIVR